MYSIGIRLGEELDLEIGDIDTERRRVHVGQNKGCRDHCVPLPEPTLQNVRRYWTTHRQPRLLFPNPSGNAVRFRTAKGPMDRGGVQDVMKAAFIDARSTSA